MEFTPLLENVYHTNFLIALPIILTIMTAIILLIIFLVTFGEGDTGKRCGLIGSSLLIIGIFAAATICNLSFDLDHKNQAISEENLKKKYAIDGALWKEWDTHVEDTTGQRLLAVQDSTGDIVSYRYRVNEVTSEPTLMNIPEGFKQSSKKPVSEILRK